MGEGEAWGRLNTPRAVEAAGPGGRLAMPGLVVYAASSPFRRRELEWSYGPAGGRGLPVSALLDPGVFENRAVVLVEDYYSVWPQVGALPGSRGYGELLDSLEAYLSRSCPARLGWEACRRTRWGVVPARGSMGGWSFEAPWPARLAAALAYAASEAGEARPGRLYTLLDAEADTATAAAALEAGEAVAAASWAPLEAVAAPRDPYPSRRGMLVPLERLWELEPPELLQRVLGRAPRSPPGGLALEPIAPGAQGLGAWEGLRVAYTSLVMARRCLLLPLLYNACAATGEPPLRRLASNAARILEAYIGSVRLVKRRVGGRAVPSLKPV